MELKTKEYRFNNGERKVEYVIPPTNTPFLSILFNKEGAVEMITVHQRVLEFHEAVMLMSLLCGVIKNEKRMRNS